MDYIFSVFLNSMGFIMKIFYNILQNYGLAIIAFTLLSKVVLLPISIWVHKNSIKMVQIQPEINSIKINCFGDEDRIADEQSKLYKREKYNPFASIIPLLIQIILLMAVVNIIYNPLECLFHLPNDLIIELNALTSQITGANNISSIQLATIHSIQNPDNYSLYMDLQNKFSNIDFNVLMNSIKVFDMNFLGFDLSWIPSETKGIAMFIPILAGLSAWVLCVIQNLANVLQSEQGKINKYSTMIISVGLSLYLGWFVPIGIAIYWVASNILAILQLLLLNALINPKKFVDYEKLEKTKQKLEELKKLGIKKNKWFEKDPYAKREKDDYKRFFSIANKHLVFYSEKSGFYKYFQNVIEELLRLSNIKIHYVTSDPNDQIFKIAETEPRIKPYYIGEKKLITLFMKMDADMVVMTMPDLDNFHIKRSYVRKDIEYVYMFHGMFTSLRTLRKGALDNYDTLLCVGPEQINEIRDLENIMNTKAKNLILCGYSLIDNMAKEYEKYKEFKKDKKIALIAPSWQSNNILESCLMTIVVKLIEQDFNIIVRPHPQYLKRNYNNLNNIVKQFDFFDDKLIFELDFSSNETVNAADILITDWSSIGFEYSISTQKPTLFINTPKKIINFDYIELEKELPLDIKLRNVVGKSLELNEISDKIIPTINELFQQKELYKRIIENVRKNNIFNFGNSGRVAAKYILNILSEKKCNDD